MCEKIYNKDFINIKKYALKIFNIYITWSIVYILLVPSYYFNQTNIKRLIIELIRKFLFLGTYYHLWYLITCCVSIFIYI